MESQTGMVTWEFMKERIPNATITRMPYISLEVRVSSYSAVKTIKLLYGNCAIALDRKLQRADEILDKFEGVNCSNHW